jgi:hypothetical protein
MVLGLPLALSVGVWTAWLSASGDEGNAVEQWSRSVCGLVMAAVVAKLGVELSVLVHLRRRQNSPLKRAATLMVAELGRVTLWRTMFGVIGGVLLPGVLLAEESLVASGGFQPPFVSGIAVLMVMLLFVGEFLERYLFFAVSVAAKMPGVQAA